MRKISLKIKKMTKEELQRQLEWTDELQRTKALGSDLTDFYYQSRREGLLEAYEMSKQPISFEKAKAQVEESLRVERSLIAV